MWKELVFIVLFLLSHTGYSQKVTGTFAHHSNQTIFLKGFDGFNNYTINRVNASAKGTFTLAYDSTDYGMGYLATGGDDSRPFFVILSGNDIELKGKNLHTPATVEVLKGKENKIFAEYASAHPKREQAISAWIYLQRMYESDTLFAVQKAPKQAVAREIQRIKAEDSLFLVQLDSNSFVSWYLPVRKLVSSVSTIAQYRPEEIPATIAAFRNLNYTDPRLYKSGLLKDAIESHFWLIENSGPSLDSVYNEMKISIDYLVENLSTDDKKLNEITDYLFDLLERHSLFEASEYLAIKVLNLKTCTLDEDLSKQLETYRAMKVGNTAPDFEFKGDLNVPASLKENTPNKLSDIKSDYIIVAFGASWCPKCQDDIPIIAKQYSKWKAHGVEVIFVSLDTDKESYQDFTGDFPFLSICDYRKWEGPIVESYYVFGTPMMYLLDSKREILLRPKSVKQMDAWVEWFLIKWNK